MLGITTLYMTDDAVKAAIQKHFHNYTYQVAVLVTGVRYVDDENHQHFGSYEVTIDTKEK